MAEKHRLLPVPSTANDAIGAGAGSIAGDTGKIQTLHGQHIVQKVLLLAIGFRVRGAHTVWIKEGLAG